MNAQLPPPDTSEAIQFFKDLDAQGRHNLVAMNPAGGPPWGKTFEPGDFPGMADFITKNWQNNLYYTPNEPKAGAPHKKLRKSDMGAIRAVTVDLDQQDGEDRALAQARLDMTVAAALTKPIKPTAVIDSGNGRQLVYRLPEKLAINPQTQGDAEALGRGMATELGGDPTQNVDRIMRIPGTINWATPAKRAAGKLGGPTRVLTRTNSVPTLDDLSTVYTMMTAPAGSKGDEAEIRAALDYERVAEFKDLPDELRKRLREAGDQAPHFKALLLGSCPPPGDGSGSDWRAALAGEMGRRGFMASEFAAVAYLWQPGQPRIGELDDRMIAHDWANLGAASAKAAAPETHLEEIGDDEIDVSAWNEQRVKQREQEIEAKANAPAVLEWVNPADWYGIEPKEKQWYVPGLVPHNEVTMLTGKGGVGKSLLGMQLMVCIAMGIAFFGREVRRAKVILFMCEDDWDEMHSRLVNICKYLDVDMRELGEWLRIAPRKYEDNLLAAFEKAGTGVQVKRTKVFEGIVAYAREFGAEVVMLDTIADVFGGDEINRQQVRQFVQGCAGRLAGEFGACLMLGHPSKSGQAEGGDGTSGSTAWRGSVRSHLYLDEDGDATGPTGSDYRKLSLQKSNYGPAGETWRLRWEAGVLKAVSSTGTRPSQAPGEPVKAGLPDTRSVMRGDVLAAIRETFEAGVPMKLAHNAKHRVTDVLRKRHRKALEGISPKDLAETIKTLAANGTIVEEKIGRDGSDNAVVSVRVVGDVEEGDGGQFFRDETSEPGLFD
jgi:RecA-family ATPase